MNTKSVIAGLYTAPPAHGPRIALIWGTTPEARVFRRKMSAYPPKEATPSWIRAPPESLSPITGAPFLRARSITLQIFSACASESEPPNTVKSCENTYTRRPSIRPWPVTTPSPRYFSSARPKSLARWVTNRSSSTNEPGSSSASSRSRAVSLPLSCWVLMRSAPPPSSDSARFFSRSSSFSRMDIPRKSSRHRPAWPGTTGVVLWGPVSRPSAPSQMLFNSLPFLYGFLPVTYLVFWRLKHKNDRYIWLTLTGYVFYAFWDYRFCGLMALSTVLAYAAGLGLRVWESAQLRRLCLIVPITIDLCLLGFFKYATLGLETANRVAAWLDVPLFLSGPHIVLPVGISFYTFHTIS